MPIGLFKMKPYAAFIALSLFSFGCSPIINRFAFYPDRKFTVPDSKLPENIEHRFITSKDHKRIESYYITNKKSDKLLIYFHGNGGNIAQRLPELIQFNSFGLNVLGVGYRGYGKSTGTPSEKGLYIDGETALKYALDSLQYKADKTFVCGRSIGTTVAINTAMSKKLSGVILITPLTNGKEYGKSKGLGLFSLLAGNSFNNVDKCKAITSPVLILHGTADEVIPYEMGKKIYAVISSKKEMITIKDGFHNNLEYVDPQLYWGSIYSFVKN